MLNLIGPRLLHISLVCVGGAELLTHSLNMKGDSILNGLPRCSAGRLGCRRTLAGDMAATALLRSGQSINVWQLAVARYYLSSSVLQGAPQRAGSVRRVPATAVEALVIKSVREHLKPSPSIDDRGLITTRVARIVVQAKQLVTN
jgi:hypothetical protein